MLQACNRHDASMQHLQLQSSMGAGSNTSQQVAMKSASMSYLVQSIVCKVSSSIARPSGAVMVVLKAQHGCFRGELTPAQQPASCQQLNQQHAKRAAQLAPHQTA